MDWNQSVCSIEWSTPTRWRCMEKRRFDEWRTDAHQLDAVREAKRSSMLRPCRSGKRMTGNGSREVGGPANTGLITFRMPQWGWNCRLDVARGTRASDSCLLPSSLHYRWSSMLEKCQDFVVFSRTKMWIAWSIQRNESDATSPLGLSLLRWHKILMRLKPLIRLKQNSMINVCMGVLLSWKFNFFVY